MDETVKKLAEVLAELEAKCEKFKQEQGPTTVPHHPSPSLLGQSPLNSGYYANRVPFVNSGPFWPPPEPVTPNSGSAKQFHNRIDAAIAVTRSALEHVASMYATFHSFEHYKTVVDSATVNKKGSE